MGAVYLGHDLQSSFKVGIKILRAADEPGSSQRFWREAHALSSLRHPGIVRYFAHGWTAHGKPYLIMEWLEGEDLAAYLRRRSLDIVDTLRLGIRVCKALATAHRQGIIHRDIKPANLFLVGGKIDDVKIVDFGLARVGQTLQEATPSGSLMGTPGFMAPEQARSDPNLNQRADVYSMGASLFACLVQRPPFVGDHPMATLAKVLFEDPPHVRDLRPDVPPGLDSVVAGMIAKEPADRPADAAEVSDLLLEVLDHLGADAPVSHAVEPAITAGEQRFLTVLLVQTTSASGRLKHSALARAANTYGAQLENMADGTIAGIFSEHSRPMEMAERAARCALSMQSELGGGPVVLATGRGITSGRLPVGQVIDRAVSLFLGDAETLPPGSSDDDLGGQSDGDIVLDDVTAGLLDRSFAVAPLGPRRYRLSGLVEETATVPRLLGIPTYCVGRQRELATLEGLLDECLDEERSRAVLLTGAAGAGKSRIRTEFLQRIEQRYSDVSVWLGRGDWLRSGAACGLLAEVVRDAIHLAESQPLDERRARISARVSELVTDSEAERIATFLGEIVNAPFEAEGHMQLAVARQDHQVMHDQMRRAFLDWLSAEIERGPILIVLDDLHWGDLPTVRFLSTALRMLRERPLMVMALAQPQVHKLFPNLFAARDVEELKLRPLSRRASTALVKQVLDVPDEVITRIVERSEGNAYFLEELIRSIAEGRRDELPQTVLALAEVRLAALPTDARRILRAASVFGRTFWGSGVSALLGDAIGEAELDTIFADLIEREFIAERATARFANTREYRFASELNREVAYGTLTEADKLHGHVRAGAWLEDAGESEAAVLAEHFRRGGAMMHAVDWYRRAAADALEADDTSGVMERVAQAEACGAQGHVLGELRLLQAEVHNWRNEPESARARAREAMELLPRGSALWANAAHNASWAASMLGKFGELEQLVDTLVSHLGEAVDGRYITAMTHMCTQLAVSGRYERARMLAEIIHDVFDDSRENPQVAAAVAQMEGIQSYMAGELDRACDTLLESADTWRALGSQRYWLLDMGNAAAAQIELGEYQAAASTLRAVLADARRVGLEHLLGSNVANFALALAHSGHIDEAKQICTDNLTTSGTPRRKVFLLVYLARILAIDHDTEQALSYAERAINMSAFPSVGACALGIKAAGLLRLGAPEAALDASSRGMAILRELGTIETGEGILRLAHAESLHALGHTQRAAEAIGVALERLHTNAARIADESRRKSFLEAVPEHARTIELGAAWSAELTRQRESPAAESPQPADARPEPSSDEEVR